MEVKPGYKQTEVGVVPEEWEVRPLGEVVDFLDGRRRPVRDSDRAKMRGDYPYYGASGIVDYVNDFIFDDDLILLGEDGENILSRNCRLAFRVSGKVWVNNHAHVLKPKAGTDIGYLSEFLESLDYDQYNTGTAQPKLNKQVCSQIPILCPKADEQRAIAAALSDVDALIGALDQLIAKKRDLKQGAMQQLLTGRQRLPGFRGEWKVKRLAELCTMRTGPFGSALHKSDYTEDGIPIVNPMHIINGMIVPTREMTVTYAAARLLAEFMLRKGDVIMGRRGEMGRCAVVTDYQVGWLCGTGSVILRPNSEIESTFLRRVLSSREAIAAIEDASVGSTMINLNQSVLRGLCIPMPSLDEQTAIAAVLSDMDAEIAALEARRDKTRALKQGMMQELLTGRVRLL